MLALVEHQNFQPPGLEGCCWLITVIIFVGYKPDVDKLILNTLVYIVAAAEGSFSLSARAVQIEHRQQKQWSCTCSLHCFVLFFFIGSPNRLNFTASQVHFLPCHQTALSNSMCCGCVC